MITLKKITRNDEGLVELTTVNDVFEQIENALRDFDTRVSRLENKY